MTTTTDNPAGDLLCFSHLRWDFVFQRPQHLLSRAARSMRVVFWEEPIWIEAAEPRLVLRTTAENVLVAQPHLPHGSDGVVELKRLLDRFVAEQGITKPVLWFYTPQALTFSGHLTGSPTVYDCMDELSAFQGADPALPRLEGTLMSRSALVFTGGQSLFEAKRTLHPSVHAFPSGVDVDHFRPARGSLPEPANQQALPYPRAGFYGVIDERIDIALLGDVADLRPLVQFVMIGPVVKIDPSILPRRANIHYLGAAIYDDLPGYVAHWDVALMPFALNEATRFISPTKTPEYLAAGRPVVSTPIADVVRQYGAMEGVEIAADAPAFAAAIDRALALKPETWRPEADRVLDGMLWDRIWERMWALIERARDGGEGTITAKPGCGPARA